MNKNPTAVFGDKRMRIIQYLSAVCDFSLRLARTQYQRNIILMNDIERWYRLCKRIFRIKQCTIKIRENYQIRFTLRSIPDTGQIMNLI
jgi:hypothetical protein